MVKSVFETVPNLCSGSPPVYQDLSTHHDWPVKRAIVDLPIRMKRNSKHVSAKLLHPLGFIDVTKKLRLLVNYVCDAE